MGLSWRKIYAWRNGKVKEGKKRAAEIHLLEEKIWRAKENSYKAMRQRIREMLEEFLPLLDQRAQRDMRRLTIAAASSCPNEACPDYPPDWPEEFPQHWCIAEKIN